MYISGICSGIINTVIGNSCDDGNTNTYNDVYTTTNGTCFGTANTIVGNTCNDGNDLTYNDVYTDLYGTCLGIPNTVIGASCDDNNSGTYNDIYTTTTGTCAGTTNTVIGASCNDNNVNTFFDKYTDTTGTCVGKGWSASVSLPYFSSSLTNFSVAGTKYTSVGQFGGIYFNVNQSSGMAKIDYTHSYTGFAGLHYYLVNKPSVTNVGNSCIYQTLPDEAYIGSVNNRYVLTIDYSNRKYWVQNYSSYTNNYTGAKNSFNPAWVNTNLSFAIEDCNSSATGSMTINSYQKIIP